jgi:hypothetical protein
MSFSSVRRSVTGFAALALTAVAFTAPSAQAPASTIVPETSSVSNQLEVRAETLGPNVAAYRVVLKNRSRMPLMWVGIKGYRGDRLSMTGRPNGKRNQPLVAANAEHSVEVASPGAGRAGSEAPEAWRSLDRIEVASLMWQDGHVEGDPEDARQQKRFDEGRAASLRSLLTVLSGAREPALAALRSELAQTMRFDAETMEARDTILADVDSLERTRRSQHGETFDTWLSRTTAEYRQWLARIVFPKS